MNSYKSSSELKSMAKGQLFGKYGVAIPAMLIPISFSVLCTFVLNLLIPTQGFVGLTIYYIAALLVQIILGIFNTGTAKLYLNMVCKHPFSASDIFYGFREQANKSLIITAFITGMSVIFYIPLIISAVIYIKTDALFMIPVITIAAILALVATCIISLTYSQCYYLIVDLPHYSAKEILALSAKLMSGHKGRLFYLQISFIGMLLLGLCSCYIGMFWILPYMETTFTNFYLNLMVSKA